MPSAFRRSQSQVYVAAFRAWDAAAGKWVWRQQSTGVTDYAAALAIAHTLEQGASAAQAGVLTRQKALAMVNDILRLAGLEEVAPSPTLATVAAGLFSSSSAGESTRRKYRAQWASLETWAGEKAKPALHSARTMSPPRCHGKSRRRARSRNGWAIQLSASKSSSCLNCSGIDVELIQRRAPTML